MKKMLKTNTTNELKKPVEEVKEEEVKELNAEQYEMIYNYLWLKKIRGVIPIALTRTLNQSDKLSLFEQDVIQIIIDYKWNTYTEMYFKKKLYFYIVFMVFFIYDLETLVIVDEHGHRVKDALYVFRKSMCFIIGFYFLVYEVVQCLNMGKAEYFGDHWNYFEVFGILIYWFASILDIANETVSDLSRMCYVLALLFSLVKILFLIRVYKNLSFLVTMIIQVMIDLKSFFIVFMIFSMIFAECFSILHIDHSSYGRLPSTIAQGVAAIRIAFGDFSIVDPYRTFDYVNPLDETEYSRNFIFVCFTFMVFLLAAILLFMVFMNFIIAVISDSYATVTSHAVAYDYKQRCEMIYEREIHFKEGDFLNQQYFPNILVVRRKKMQDHEGEITNACL